MSNRMSKLAALVVVLAVTFAVTSAFAQDTMAKDSMSKGHMDKMMTGHKSSPFAGPKANKGYVTHTKEGKVSVLTLSDDFVVPDTPDPHWAVVDSKGVMYHLDRLHLKPQGMAMEDHGKRPDRYQKSIKLPAYITDVKKVVLWCAWAEANLGEASFEKPGM